MEHKGPTSWLLHLPLLPHDSKYIHVNGAVLVFLGILAFSIAANRAIKGKLQANIIPSKRFGIGTIADFLVEGLYNLVIGILGHHGEEHFSFVAALFFFIYAGNLLGLLPLSGSPTADTNTTFALGAVSFVYYNVMGIKAHGLGGYAKHFLMGLGFMGLPIALLELISHSIRPVTLGLRLFINLHIDHMLVSAFQSLMAWVLPVPLLLFGIVVCTIQAFLFAVLSTVYIQMATEHE